MTTLLFPENDNPIIFHQGQTGDCYLLAALDCILNTSHLGLDYIKSLFTETEQGVTVRIKRSAISECLQTGHLEDKYGYFYDRDTNEDVFIIGNERLKEIDERSSDFGVQTNSLAIKILEHLISYYYAGDWLTVEVENSEFDMFTEFDEIYDSVAAHNVNVSQRHPGLSSGEFVSNFLGVACDTSSDIGKIIKFKTDNPDYPVFISMNYGKIDEYNKIHSRHALRLDKVDATNTEDIVFTLVNPWNNTNKETYTLKEITSRHPRFCIFKSNTAKIENLDTDITSEDDTEYNNIAIDAYLGSVMNKLSKLKRSVSFEGESNYEKYKNTIKHLDLSVINCADMLFEGALENSEIDDYVYVDSPKDAMRKCWSKLRGLESTIDELSPSNSDENSTSDLLAVQIFGIFAADSTPAPNSVPYHQCQP